MMKKELNKIIKENIAGDYSNGIILGPTGKGKSYSLEILEIAKNENISYSEALESLQIKKMNLNKPIFIIKH